MSVRVLELDVGNTAAKWRLLAGDRIDGGRVELSAAELSALFGRCRPSVMRVASVAGGGWKKSSPALPVELGWRVASRGRKPAVVTWLIVIKTCRVWGSIAGWRCWRLGSPRPAPCLLLMRERP